MHVALSDAGYVIGCWMLSPLDFESTIGLTGGDIFHGALSLSRLFSTRPMRDHAAAACRRATYSSATMACVPAASTTRSARSGLQDPPQPRSTDVNTFRPDYIADIELARKR